MDKNCTQCETAKGLYTGPNKQEGSIVANNTIEVLCKKFTKMSSSKNRKEKILVMTDSFSKFSVAVVMPNYQASTVAKAQVDR